MTTLAELLARLEALLPPGLEPPPSWQAAVVGCECGGSRWESEPRCPACGRKPLPPDEELRRQYEASTKIRGPHDSRVRHLDPRTVVATPPRLIKPTGRYTPPAASLNARAPEIPIREMKP